jgi:hypothetical protein
MTTEKTAQKAAYAAKASHGYSHAGDLYLDASGNRYTTSVAAVQGDPWWGATILTRSIVARLREEGRLPLTEVMCLWDSPSNPEGGEPRG